MDKRVVSMIRDYLPQLVDPNPQQRANACAGVVDTYRDQTQGLLYQLLADADLAVCQQAALALRAIDEWAASKRKAPAHRSLYICCLGPLRLFDGRHEIRFDDWATQRGGRAGWLKVLGIFAYLVDRGRGGATRTEIGDAVWNSSVSANSLSRTLSTLRETLADLISPTFVEQALTVTPERCSLSGDAYLTDAQVFERLFNLAVDTEEQDGLEAAVPFYSLTVDQYAGLYMEGVPYAEETYHERRHHLLNSLVIATERLADYFYHRQFYRPCVSCCQRALEFEPALEDITLWLLRAWEALHLRGELEQAYRTYLRETAIHPDSTEAQEDSVVQFYQHLHRAKAVGE